MKTKLTRLALAIAATGLLVQPPARAQQCEAPRDVAIAFINGVDVDFDGYETGRARLEQEFGKHYTGADTFDRQVLYPAFHNPSDTLVLDIYESLQQIRRQQPEWNLSFPQLYGWMKKLSFFPDWVYPDRSPFDAVASAALAALIRGHTPEITDEMVSKMRDLVDRKLNVLVVSHSQGNLYATALEKAMRQRLHELNRSGQYKTLHVAPPAEIDMRNKYITNDNDMVVNFSRRFDTHAPLGNVTVSALLQKVRRDLDPFGHGFVDLYMTRDLQPYAGSAGVKGIKTLLADHMAELTRSDAICPQVDSRRTWIQYQDLPPVFPPVLPPEQLNLAAHGIVPGDVIELASNGSWSYDGYWGGTGQTTGAAGIFADDAAYLGKAMLGQGDTGASPEAAPMTNECTNVTPIDNPYDFLIPDAAWARVKVPAGATRLLLGISDCFQGDNLGTVSVAIRKLEKND
nr:hypothetical protein [uncultured Duganella sp.]